jgi:hypothetical protein
MTSIVRKHRSLWPKVATLIEATYHKNRRLVTVESDKPYNHITDPPLRELYDEIRSQYVSDTSQRGGVRINIIHFQGRDVTIVNLMENFCPYTFAIDYTTVPERGWAWYEKKIRGKGTGYPECTSDDDP